MLYIISIYLSIYSSLQLKTYIIICIYLSIYLSIFMYIYIYTMYHIHLSIYLSIVGSFPPGIFSRMCSRSTTWSLLIFQPPGLHRRVFLLIVQFFMKNYSFTLSINLSINTYIHLCIRISCIHHSSIYLSIKLSIYLQAISIFLAKLQKYILVFVFFSFFSLYTPP